MADRAERPVEAAERPAADPVRTGADPAELDNLGGSTFAPAGNPGGSAPESVAGAGGSAAAATDRPGRAERHWRLAHLPVVLGASLALLVVATVLGAVVGGGAGAAGAATGVGLVTLSYLASTLVIAWADSVNPSLVLPFGVAMYVAKFSVIGVVMAGVAGRGWDGLPAFGWGVVAGVVAWTGANIWWVSTVHVARTRRTAGG
ncbi:hypothetical protein [Plantactinospora endophytica]|uniref:ATP synthase protein I n=1 Tax=Plantactinospora endophytica TaxID=673535 RepID=A0ABQ4E3U7_9ACTN|nr:hypothetical protein [Plantactinospora endophytica]GIG89365.1 hypothetical protein Pen02_43010 [Plantactinospora endophytica]